MISGYTGAVDEITSLEASLTRAFEDAGGACEALGLRNETGVMNDCGNTMNAPVCCGSVTDSCATTNGTVQECFDESGWMRLMYLTGNTEMSCCPTSFDVLVCIALMSYPYYEVD